MGYKLDNISAKKLLIAVIEQAAADFRNAYKKVLENPNNYTKLKECKEIEDFFGLICLNY